MSHRIRLFVLLGLLILVSAFVPTAYAAPTWVTVGTPGFSAGAAAFGTLALDGSTPYVAYSDLASFSQATVMKFDGTTWVTVGTAGFSAGTADYTSLALDGSTPYVAYRDGASGGKATVMKFDGTNWVNVGTAGFSAGNASHISLALDGSTPYVLYEDGASGNKATVMKFDGTTWVNVGTAGFSASSVQYNSLALDGSTPYAAYADNSVGFKATVLKFDGTTWVPVGTVGLTPGTAAYNSLALDSSTPYLSFRDGSNTNKATVMKFDGTNWVNVGTAGFSAGGVIYTSLALDGSTPYVAYADGSSSNKATVMKFDGTTWVNVGSAGFSAGGALNTSLALDGSTPYVLYQDGASSNKATVMKFVDPQSGPNYVVNDSSDTDDGSCDIAPLDCTLREAINAANALAGADTISFDIPATDGGCSGANVCTIMLGATLPPIADDVTIDGVPNSGHITVSGNNAVTVMQVNNGKTLSVNALAIVDGKALGNGGGIFNGNGTLNVTNSAFSGNSAPFNGGALLNNGGTLNVTNSTFSGNSATNAGSGNGGGIYSYNGTLNVTNSTFSGNSATNSGGGIYNDNGTTTLRNSIIANSTTGGDCGSSGGTFTADAFNLDSDGSCASATQKTVGQIALAALADNGGPTPTMALGATSAAINAGDDTVCADPLTVNNLDQRGITRPQGPRCDVGAFELVYTPTQAGPNFVVNHSADTDDGSCDLLGQGIVNQDCTLREAINAANALSGADTITFNIPYPADLGCTAANVCIITLTNFLNTIQDSLTIDGAPNNGDITVNGANTYQIFSVRPTHTFTVNRLTLTNGFETGGNGGGAIYSISGNVIVTNTTFRNNIASEGGGIRASDGTLRVSNSTFVGNSADNGGAIFTGAFGASVVNSTFYNNSSSGDGGALLNTRGLFVANSTLSGNSASGSGGGVLAANNMTLVNTIVADSTGGDCAVNGGSLTADSFNIATDASCDNATPKSSAQIALGALGPNGGPTKTMALGNSSVAIDAGDASVCDDNPGPNNLDQRGSARNDLQCDVGAFEFVNSDGHTVAKNLLNFGPLYTFGPTLAGVTSGSFYSPTLTINRELTPPVNTPPANALPITWDATAKTGGFSFIFTLCYDPAVLTGQNEAALHVYHYNGSTWDDLGGTLDNTTHLPYHCVTATTALTSLSPLALAPFTPTAVNVAGVKGLLTKKGDVRLKWRTLNESFLTGFNVYRKTRGGEWEKINRAFLTAKQPGSPAGAKYRFKDATVKRDKTYSYKIEVHYSDNHTEWTEVVQVKTR